MRIGVTGSRHWPDRASVWRALDALKPRPDVLIHGGARGVDQWANEWACVNRVFRVTVRPGDEARKSDYLVRNSLIVEFADKVLAFRAGGKSNGTDDTIEKAQAADKLLAVVTTEKSE